MVRGASTCSSADFRTSIKSEMKPRERVAEKRIRVGERSFRQIASQRGPPMQRRSRRRRCDFFRPCFHYRRLERESAEIRQRKRSIKKGRKERRRELTAASGPTSDLARSRGPGSGVGPGDNPSPVAGPIDVIGPARRRNAGSFRIAGRGADDGWLVVVVTRTEFVGIAYLSAA